MISYDDIKRANNVEYVFKRYTLNKGIILDSFLFDTLLKPTPGKDRQYDFDVYLQTFGINLQRPYVWEGCQQRDFILSLLWEKPIEKVIAIIHNDDVKRSESTVHIIDGKQRLLTIQKFLHNEFPIILNNKEIYFKDFDESAYYWLRNRVDYITADVFYSYANKPISDVDKIKIFNFYNFSGTPQTEEHKNKLQNLIQ